MRTCILAACALLMITGPLYADWDRFAGIDVNVRDSIRADCQSGPCDDLTYEDRYASFGIHAGFYYTALPYVDLGASAEFGTGYGMVARARTSLGPIHLHGGIGAQEVRARARYDAGRNGSDESWGLHALAEAQYRWFFLRYSYQEVSQRFTVQDVNEDPDNPGDFIRGEERRASFDTTTETVWIGLRHTF